MPNSEITTAAPTDDQKNTVVRLRESQTDSVYSAPPASTKADKKKLAQEKAAQREVLLNSRNAAYVINFLERKTHFDAEQIKALQRIYRRFKGPYSMDRLRFREMVASLLGISDNMMLDRIFQAFDGDNEGSVSEAEWIIGLSVQLRGTLDQQIAYTYDVYDVNGDRSIGRDEIQSFYKNSIHAIKGTLEPEEVDDAINELVELAMKKFDIDKDGNISFPEFSYVVRKDPLLLEAFGECLPPDSAAVPTVGLLDMNERSYKCYLSRPGDSGWSGERERYNKFKFGQGHSGYFYNSKTDTTGQVSSTGIVRSQQRKSTRGSKSNRESNFSSDKRKTLQMRKKSLGNFT